MAQNIRFRRTL